MLSLVQKIIGSRNERFIKKVSRIVQKINSLEPEFEKLSDEQLKAKTFEYRERLANGEILDNLLPEAFATVREAGKRTKNMRHYDVQLIGGIVLHQGKVAEMRTGEGKTLVATLPAYLNALTGDGVHVITVNDYLAKRDAELMSDIYEFLGMSVGVIVADLNPQQRKEAYACDITYGTNNEFGFDYLRDNMAYEKEQQVQRSRNYVIIDEVDSILIDEARTPLIISGASDDSSEMYNLFNRLVPYLEKQEKEEVENEQEQRDFYVDEKSKNAYLTEKGYAKIENMLKKEGILEEDDNLYSPHNITKMHYLNACLRAHSLYQLNIDYIVRDQEIVIIDESTGRAMPGRRWSDGLHQAIEAKEGVKVNAENQTMASITFQNFFKLYNKIAGMTGTADTEAFELHSIYGLEVIIIPTNKPMIRKDHHDEIYGSVSEKFDAIVEDIKERISKGQPVLVGTASIEASEVLSTLLKKKKIRHNVLNAKQHEKEASIIAMAGYPDNVTIATNMAGRGTDIILGGNLEVEIAQLEDPTPEDIAQIKAEWLKRNEAVKKAGGLCIIGSERHDSRRIDNQLRGRAARQGDPGESKFYLSMDDNLLRIFASQSMAERVKKGLKGGESLAFGFMSKVISKAQGKVESYHFDIRKNLLEYDNVVNTQRKVIYEQRQSFLEAEDVSDILADIRIDVAEQLFHDYVPAGSMHELWDLEGLEKALKSDFMIELDLQKLYEEDDSLGEEDLKRLVREAIEIEFVEKTKNLDSGAVRQFEKFSLLQSLDTHWREHLSSIDHLRNSINLRGYAQKDPKNEYKKEAFELFSTMLDNFKYEVISSLAKIRIATEEETQRAQQEWQESMSDIKAEHESVIDNNQRHDEDEQEEAPKVQQVRREGPKVKRNDPCPCGSGKKYKQCHSKVE
ncbi:preprotein translocase subunit SecA [Francisella tularensis]|uniref:Protein translocase subunit SecA n=1 Tax=Francisella tularensis subsp. tularensis (strain WY96-3418) TaxID=418136 RepID=SECA_FRATW|nr:preprotein translocase subunit SecA [Francisella tularensis]A4IZ46.1 RecName: Full=Protein translocase subunit SecA [Francisella tularensis subsp. tularensis WY96-3418]ABO47197.1 preprotein translocase, SecA subunit [Francisella tularensis subsp. tularensis WY96-3418]AJI62941.1 preprotein translocase, SecA subunit [Francisella tularensis subsp. tularensis]AKH92351.1 preprotein translocase subunit SecA [Francisella tularensis subsp. tularensis WY-00W4114]AKU73343.1 preprotein translocase, Se